MKEGDLYNGEELQRGWSIKTNGDSDFIVIKDDNYFNQDGSKKRKVRNNPTNITVKNKKQN